VLPGDVQPGIAYPIDLTASIYRQAAKSARELSADSADSNKHKKAFTPEGEEVIQNLLWILLLI
jgi:hypothetical protein